MAEDLQQDLDKARARIAQLEDELSSARPAHLAALQDQLREAHELASMASVARGVVHDANNLITAMQGHLELLQAELPAATPGAEHVHTLQTLVDRIRELNQRVFGLAQRGRPQLEAFDIAAHLRDAEGFLRRLAGEDNELQLAFRVEEATTRADPMTLDLAICNVVLNAREAMPEGGRITVVLDEVEIRPGLSAIHPHLVPGRYVSVRVADTGEGMDEATRTRVFEPSFTTKPAHSGLGLHTVLRVVRGLQGAIEIASKVGTGSTVEILLPSLSASARSGPRRREAPLGGTETVLVVEDEPQVRAFVKHVLARAGYQVLLAADGVEGLETFVAEAARIDLLLSDVVLPRMSGPELVDEIWSGTPGLRVLMMSGYPDSVLEQRGPLPLRAPLLDKPFTSADLLRHVRAALDAAAPGGDEDASDATDLRESTQSGRAD